MNKAIAYIRVSTEKQAIHGVSLEAQEKKIKEYCTRKNLDLSKIMIDKGVSGGTKLKNRPEGCKISQEIAAGITHIVSVKLDRLFRDTVDALVSIETWEEKGVALHLLDFAGEEVSSNSSAGKLMFTIHAGFAQMEKDLIKERTTVALSHKKAKGERCGQIPFGYTVNNKVLVEVPGREKALECIHELHKIGKSSRFIADAIQSDFGLKVSHVTVNKLIKEI